MSARRQEEQREIEYSRIRFRTWVVLSSFSWRGKAPRRARESGWYDVAIMMSRTQITLENEVQRRARQRASELGVSLAEYVRRLVARDLARPESTIAVDRVFDLGSSGGAHVIRDKDSMIAEAFQAKRRKAPRR